MTLEAATIPRQRPAPDSEHAESWTYVERAQAGDREAFAALYTRYREPVMRFVRGKVRDEHLAEDLTQDVFHKALRSIGRVEYQGRDYGAWLMTLARNLVNDHFKSAATRLEICLDFGAGEYFLDGPAAGPISEAMQGGAYPDVADVVVALMRDGGVFAAVERLTSPVQRRCIRLRFFEDMSVAEAAAAMGITEGACKALQFRATRALRRLAPELFDWRVG